MRMEDLPWRVWNVYWIEMGSRRYVSLGEDTEISAWLKEGDVELTRTRSESVSITMIRKDATT